MKKPEYIFECRMEVRDYECDLQGIVNNANYQHYTEHTRHLFLHAIGMSFADMHNRGTDAVVAQMTMRFKTPLRSDDVFVSRLAMRREGMRYVFYQDIFRLPDDKMVFSSQVDVVCLVNGRLGLCEELDEKVAKFVAAK
jgi:acyl-CoA thioester hydrolase